MKQQVLSSFDMPWLPLVALAIFMISFAAYTWWTFRKDRKPQYEAISMIPLDEE